MNPDAPSQHAKKLMILLCVAEPGQPETCLMPLVYAATAAAMEVEVEVHFTGRAVRLLVEGVAASLKPGIAGGKSLYDYLRDAALLGAHFLGCSMALAEYVGAHEPKIAEFGGAAGAATVLMRSLDPEWQVLSF